MYQSPKTYRHIPGLVPLPGTLQHAKDGAELGDTPKPSHSKNHFCCTLISNSGSSAGDPDFSCSRGGVIQQPLAAEKLGCCSRQIPPGRGWLAPPGCSIPSPGCDEQDEAEATSANSINEVSADCHAGKCCRAALGCHRNSSTPWEKPNYWIEAAPPEVTAGSSAW